MVLTASELGKENMGSYSNGQYLTEILQIL